jgi:multidrug resistance efflux pump
MCRSRAWRKGDFEIAIKTRCEIRSTKSTIITAPQVPDPRIVKLAVTGTPVHKGDVIVEFDRVQQEQNYLDRNTSAKTTDERITQLKASQRMEDEQDSLNLTSKFDLDRAKLDASKAESVSKIEGAKTRINVGLYEGTVKQIDDHWLARRSGA